MQNTKYSVKLSRIVEQFSLQTVYAPENIDELEIIQNDVNRPGLQFAGFYEHFDNTRIQIIGKSESAYLRSKNERVQDEICEAFLAKKPSAVVLALQEGIEPLETFINCAKKYEVPVFKIDNVTSDFMAALISYLNTELAERQTMHGVLIEIYGEGVLLLGSSGVGKSETAIELVKRGHRLVADDAVEIKRVSPSTLVGSAPEVIRHFIELRGIGIVDVRRIFGMGSVKVTEKIELVVNLEPWEEGKHYDRLGMDSKYTDILGIKVPSLEVPVKPGRNLAVILEVAAMSNRHKKMGFNAAQDLSDRMEKAFNMPIIPLKEDE
ncbi:MAG: HPr(Ser) kinase/phosphatase [Clostridia bacterium]